MNKILYTLLTVTLLLVLAACNKSDDDFFYKGDMLPVTLTGYNGSNEVLEVKLDTTIFPSLSPNNAISQATTYIFYGNQPKATLTIKEKGTGKLVLQREIDKREKNVVVSIIYVDGKIMTIDPPAANPNTNKVGLYIVNNENDDLADLQLLDQDLNLLTYIGNNIVPNKWVYFDVDFKTTVSQQIPIFFKAGTADIGYYNNDIVSSYISTGNPFFATDGTKGQVRSFLIVYSASWGETLAIQL